MQCGGKHTCRQQAGLCKVVERLAARADRLRVRLVRIWRPVDRELPA